MADGTDKKFKNFKVKILKTKKLRPQNGHGSWFFKKKNFSMNSDWIFFLYSCVSIHSELPCKISWKNSQKQKSYGQKTAAEDDFLRFSHGRRHPKIFFFIKSDLSSQFSPPWWILHHKTKKQKSYGQKSLKKGKVPGPLYILKFS